MGFLSLFVKNAEINKTFTMLQNNSRMTRGKRSTIQSNLPCPLARGTNQQFFCTGMIFLTKEDNYFLFLLTDKHFLGSATIYFQM